MKKNNQTINRNGRYIHLLLITFFVVISAFLNCTENSTESVFQKSLSAPVIDSIVPGEGQIQIFWNAVNGAESYTVNRDTIPGVSSSTLVKFEGLQVTYHTSLNLSCSKTYYFRVAAVGSDKQKSELSNEVFSIPVTDILYAPKWLKVTASDTTSLTLLWESSTCATHYTLYWGTDTGVTDTSTKITDITVLSYKHTGLSKNTTYYYRVSAQNDDALSSILSAEINGTPKEVKDKTDGKNGDKKCTEGVDPVEVNGSTWECIGGIWKCTSGNCNKNEHTKCTEGDAPVKKNGNTYECIDGVWKCTSGNCGKS